MVKLAIFVAVACIAFFIDIYLDKHPLDLIKTEPAKNKTINANCLIYYYNPFSSLTAKFATQNIPSRIFCVRQHNKLIQKYHQQHKFIEPDKEAKKIRDTGILFNNCLLFKNYCYVFPDEDPPLIS